MRSADRVLATEMADGTGPYASLVMLAADQTAAPLLLISTGTTRRTCSKPQGLDPDRRYGWVGRALTDRACRCKARFQKPRLQSIEIATCAATSAEMYAGHDFYAMTVERVHLVAGLGGSIGWKQTLSSIQMPVTCR